MDPMGVKMCAGDENQAIHQKEGVDHYMSRKQGTCFALQGRPTSSNAAFKPLPEKIGQGPR